MTRPITPEDLWNLSRVGQPEPGPDGSFAVVPVTRHDGDDGDALTRLYRIDLDGTTTALTGDAASSTSPVISPDGSRVAFLRPAGDAGKPQVHVMPLGGGEAECLTDLPLGAVGLRWLPDASALVAIVPLLRGHPSVDVTLQERDRRDEVGEEPVVTEDRVYRFWKKWLAGGEIHHVFRIDLEGDAVDLTAGFESVLGYEPTIDELAVRPDGTEVIFSALVALDADQHQTALFRVSIDGSDVRRVTDEPVAHERRPRFSPDGGRLLYGRQPEWDFYADRSRLMIRDLVTGDEQELIEGWDRNPTGWEFDGSGRIVLGADDDGRYRLFSMADGDAAPVAIDLPHSAHGARPAGERLWCRTESLAAPPEVAEVSTGLRTGFNDDLLGELELGAVADLTFEGADGEQIQTFVVYPPGFDSSRTWPLVHDIHGGPHGASGDTWHWRWNAQVFAAGGYVVATVNFHGSTGWGDRFTRSIRGAWGDKPSTDVLAATDYLIGLGFIDENRMAITGGSYGGYLVTWLTGITDRFAAAICHAGVNDLLGQWASDITAGREKSIGGVPWESMDDVMRWSPLARTHAMSTPTLVVHGELDYRVVVTQGLVLYGVLKHKGVPARLVYYPDEGHWIERRSNSLHWYGEFMAWLDRWIGEGSNQLPDRLAE